MFDRNQAEQLQRLSMSQYRLFQQVSQLERTAGIQNVAEACEDLVRTELGIHLEVLKFDAKIVTMGETEEAFDEAYEGGELELGEELPSSREFREDLEAELAKRRIINGIVHGGAARTESASWTNPMIGERVGDQTPGLYQELMDVSRKIYRTLPEDFHAKQGGMQHAGMSFVRGESDPPTVVARAVCAPVLVQELAKGSLEAVARWGLPGAASTDPELKAYYQQLQRVVLAADDVAHDVRDNQRGPALWEKATGGRDKMGWDELKQLFLLPPKEFLKRMEL